MDPEKIRRKVESEGFRLHAAKIRRIEGEDEGNWDLSEMPQVAGEAARQLGGVGLMVASPGMVKFLGGGEGMVEADIPDRDVFFLAPGLRALKMHKMRRALVQRGFPHLDGFVERKRSVAGTRVVDYDPSEYNAEDYKVVGVAGGSAPKRLQSGVRNTEALKTMSPHDRALYEDDPSSDLDEDGLVEVEAEWMKRE